MNLKKLWLRWTEPKPFHEGYLPEADGHQVYFAEYGNPDGVPIMATHGGPGGRTRAGHASCFDLRKHRVIMFDQRGCGKSVPAGAFKHNTMDDIVWDMKRLYDYLGLTGKVILRGASWGSTVMLCFAEKYPQLVEKMLLSQIFLADNRTAEWFDSQSALFYPEFMEEMSRGMERWKSLPEYYAGLINSSSVKKQLCAANYYGWYERVLANENPSWGTTETLNENELNSLRIYLNYAAKSYTLKSNQIMRGVKKIAKIPTLFVHNRLDMVCPLQSVYELHKAMPNSKLVIVPEKGHVGDLLYKTIKQEIKMFL